MLDNWTGSIMILMAAVGQQTDQYTYYFQLRLAFPVLWVFVLITKVEIKGNNNQHRGLYVYAYLAFKRKCGNLKTSSRDERENTKAMKIRRVW